MITFQLQGRDGILLAIDPRVEERLSQKRNAAMQAVNAVLRAGIALPATAETMARHPAANGLTSHRAGHLGREKAGAMIELLAQTPPPAIRLLEQDIPFVCQAQCLLPEADTRGESIVIDEAAPTDPAGLRDLYQSVIEATGESWRRFVSVIKSVSLVTVRGMPDLPFFSGSGNDIWGSMHMSNPAHAAILAESMTHEAAHFWLHAVEEVGELADQAWSDETWVSPWREDPRPIGGVIHGIHVFSCAATVLASWLRVGVNVPRCVDTGFLGRRAATLVAQVEAGISEFKRNGRGTTIGQSICSASENRIRQLEPLIPASDQQSAREIVQERRRRKIEQWRMAGRAFTA
jgi:hypothetical protein